MGQWRSNLPAGPLGESWDLSVHPHGMSVVASGPLAGRTLRELTNEFGAALVGDGFTGGDFPLLVKLIDANDRLSVQVHPDDHLARELNVGPRGKTECWLMLANGGELFVGTKPGTTRASFEAALTAGRVADLLQRFTARTGDFYLLPGRTVHALGAGCLIYEVQQTCDVTFRVDDWGRIGLDGKPRQLHVAESLATIDFAARSGPVTTPAKATPDGGSLRQLVDGAHFSVDERRGVQTTGDAEGQCSIIVCLAGHGQLATAGGAVALTPMRTHLVPAAAGRWTATTSSGDLHLLVARPVLH